jgi:hypothetical protein
MAADLNRSDELGAADFTFGPETPLDEAHPNRLMALLAASLAIGFVGVSGAALVIVHLANTR